MAFATGWSNLRITSEPTHTNPTGRTAYQPPAQSRSVTGSGDRGTRAPTRSTPSTSPSGAGFERTVTAKATGASTGPSAAGTGTRDQSSPTSLGPPFSGFSLRAAGSSAEACPEQPTSAAKATN